MTRINTNISSLLAQNSLATSDQELQTSLTRLSTGLRINSGADDPSGMIASTALQSDITSVNSAISNSQMAEQMISTADSGLGQVSSLLNNIQSLVTSAANSGTMTSDQISADQLQIDSSLNAINQIAQSTSFQGQNLLDGSLDFNTNKGAGGSNITGLQVNQADLSSGPQQVSVNVTAAAQQAQLDANNIVASNGSGTAATATVQLTGGTIKIAAPNDSASYNDVAVNFIEQSGVNAAGGPTAAYNSSTGKLNITVDNTSSTSAAAIATAVEQAGFTVTGTPAGTFTPGTTSLTSSAATPATALLTFADGGELQIQATTAGVAANGTTISVAEGASVGAAYTAASGKTAAKLAITTLTGGTTSLSQLAQAINTTGNFTATVVNPGEYQSGTDVLTATAGTAATAQISDANVFGGVAGPAVMNFTTTGDSTTTANVVLQEAAGQGTTPSVVWNPTGAAGVGQLTITIDSSASVATSLASIQSAVAKSGSPFTMDYSGATALIGSGTAGIDSTQAAAGGAYQGLSDPVFASGAAAVTGANTTFSGGQSSGGGLLDDVSFQLTGSTGNYTFNFNAGAQLTDIISAINAQTSTTGVTAAANSNNGLTFSSTGVGSTATVKVAVDSEDGSQAFTNGLTAHGTTSAATQATGTDVQGTINGVTANGSGNTLSINNSNLSASVTLKAGASGQSDFTITGGGALFQLGPNVVANEQADLGIQSVDASSLGGIDGLLSELGSGGTAALATNPSLANSIVNEAISQVSDLRGRLGAFQSTTLESNVSSLNDTLQNLTSAQSSIKDADFAAESANLTRAQVLEQSGISVLAIANKLPQNVLSLLQNA
jgi:flagellin